MSAWTNEKHDAARLLASDYDHPREITFMSGDLPPWEHLGITLGSALDEIERLRAALDHTEGERSMSTKKKISAGDTLTVGDLTDDHLGAFIEVGPLKWVWIRLVLERSDAVGTAGAMSLSTAGGGNKAFPPFVPVKILTPPPVVQPDEPTALGQCIRIEGDDDFRGVVADPGSDSPIVSHLASWCTWGDALGRAGNRQIIVSDPPRWPDETPEAPERIEVGEWPDDDTHLREWEWIDNDSCTWRWDNERKRWVWGRQGHIRPIDGPWTRGERVE